ncbi:MAG: hypothetical protein LBJ88_04800 [Campylobacteraceae bacterium]|jgi:hypothetical protein|nr:hypothetical protein [Campylobacteraceae bacterium]
MQNETNKEYILNVKREFDAVSEETNTLLLENQTNINSEEKRIINEAKDKKYHINITSFMIDEAKERSERLMYEVRMIVPNIISSDSRFNYLYIIIAFLFLLLILSVVKRYIF